MEFLPLHFFFKWAETISLRNMITVVIKLPSGTEGTYAVYPIDDGNTLQLSVEYPDHMIQALELHQYWLHPEECAPTDHVH